jgi:hypothetical protein
MFLLLDQEAFLMKRIIALTVVSLIAILACSLSPPQPPQVEAFKNDAFSFSIPEDWSTGTANYLNYGPAFELIVGITDRSLLPNAMFTVTTSPLIGDKSLESRFTQTYAVWFMENVSKQEFIQGELSGFEIYYSHNLGEGWNAYHDIWLEKDGVIYVLSFSCPNNSIDDYADIFDQILDSFSFKD